MRGRLEESASGPWDCPPAGFDEVSHLRNHAILVGVAESRPIAEIRAAKLVSDPST